MHRRLDYAKKQERKIVNTDNSLDQKSPVGASLLAKGIREQARSYRGQPGNTQWGFELILILLFTTTSVHAEGLGRLFFTPAQRNQLDHHIYRPRPVVTSADTPADMPDNQLSLTVNGIVQRNGGKRTAWINGTERAVGPGDESTPASVMVNIPDQNKMVRLKVGQRILLTPATNTNTAKPIVGKPTPANDD